MRANKIACASLQPLGEGEHSHSSSQTGTYQAFCCFYDWTHTYFCLTYSFFFSYQDYTFKKILSFSFFSSLFLNFCLPSHIFFFFFLRVKIVVPDNIKMIKILIRAKEVIKLQLTFVVHHSICQALSTLNTFHLIVLNHYKKVRSIPIL